MARGQVFSVGYIGYTPAAFDNVVAGFDKVVDVRSSPFSRKAGFSGKALAGRLGSRYVWKGAVLGGRPPGVTLAGINWILDTVKAGESLILICKEEAPGSCHRHLSIARMLLLRGEDVWHVYQDQVVKASDLDPVLSNDKPYRFASTRRVLRQVRERRFSFE